MALAAVSVPVSSTRSGRASCCRELDGELAHASTGRDELAMVARASGLCRWTKTSAAAKTSRSTPGNAKATSECLVHCGAASAEMLISP